MRYDPTSYQPEDQTPSAKKRRIWPSALFAAAVVAVPAYAYGLVEGRWLEYRRINDTIMENACIGGEYKNKLAAFEMAMRTTPKQMERINPNQFLVEMSRCTSRFLKGPAKSPS